jgi:type VI secretion system protein ImpH
MATASGGTSITLNKEFSLPSPVDAPSTGAAARGAKGMSVVQHSPPLVLREEARTVEDRLFDEPYSFDFFQAVRILERWAPDRRPVGRGGPALSEIVRFRAHLALTFPPSSIYDLQGPSESLPLPAMTVSFLGLTGPSGVLPRHYTELLLRLAKEAKGPEKNALRDWYDLFNHRLISLFYRAWEKYRFYIAYERGDYKRGDQLDPFTHCLFSFIGLGEVPLRNRLRVVTGWPENEREPQRILAGIPDLALLHYSGFLAHRPRCALSLEALLEDYFQLPIRIQQFQGQWLVLDRANQSRMGGAGGNNQLGVNLVAGERVWDVQSKIRVRMGPLRYGQFTEFLPDYSPVAQRKAFFVLAHVVRLYVGPELDFDVQLVLGKEEVPECELTADAAGGPLLGWNTWIRSQPPREDADQAVFAGDEVYRMGSQSMREDADQAVFRGEEVYRL